jgi:dihydroorotase
VPYLNRFDIHNVPEAAAYHAHILTLLPANMDFEPLVILYPAGSTSPVTLRYSRWD